MLEAQILIYPFIYKDSIFTQLRDQPFNNVRSIFNYWWTYWISHKIILFTLKR